MKIFKVLLCIAIFGLIIYSGIQLGRPYYRYYAFKAKVEDISRFEENADKILTTVMEQAQEIGIPITEADVAISGSKGRYAIETSWSETVNLFDIYEHTYNFQIQVGK